MRTTLRLSGDHIDAIHRAGFHAQIAAGAFCRYNRMHLFRGTENCIYRTGLYALGATDTFGFANNRQLPWSELTMGRIQWHRRDL